MEDVLDVYTRPQDPARLLLCLDETSGHFVAGVIPSRQIARREAHESRLVKARIAITAVKQSGSPPWRGLWLPPPRGCADAGRFQGYRDVREPTQDPVEHGGGDNRIAGR
jgi:hypothetical protein